MADGVAVLAGLPIPSTSPVFLAAVGLHVLAGLICAASGLVAMLSRKGRGRHSTFGTIYFWGLVVVFLSSAGLAISRWAEDYPLFILGSLAMASAGFGRTAMRRRWPGFVRHHIAGMGASYVVLLTAFYVDNGHSLPVWRTLPPIAFWLLPSVVGRRSSAMRSCATRWCDDRRASWRRLARPASIRDARAGLRRGRIGVVCARAGESRFWRVPSSRQLAASGARGNAALHHDP